MDGRPNRRNKAVFSNSSNVARTLRAYEREKRRKPRTVSFNPGSENLVLHQDKILLHDILYCHQQPTWQYIYISKKDLDAYLLSFHTI